MTDYIVNSSDKIPFHNNESYHDVKENLNTSVNNMKSTKEIYCTSNRSKFLVEPSLKNNKSLQYINKPVYYYEKSCDVEKFKINALSSQYKIKDVIERTPKSKKTFNKSPRKLEKMSNLSIKDQQNTETYIKSIKFVNRFNMAQKEDKIDKSFKEQAFLNLSSSYFQTNKIKYHHKRNQSYNLTGSIPQIHSTNISMHNLNEEEKNPTLFQKTCYQQPFNTNSDSQIMMPKIKRYSEDKGKDDMPDIFIHQTNDQYDPNQISFRNLKTNKNSLFRLNAKSNRNLVTEQRLNLERFSSKQNEKLKQILLAQSGPVLGGENFFSKTLNKNKANEVIIHYTRNNVNYSKKIKKDMLEKKFMKKILDRFENLELE